MPNSKGLKPCKPHQVRRKTSPRRCVNRDSKAGKLVLAARSRSKSPMKSPIRKRSKSVVKKSKELKPCKPHQVRRKTSPRRCVNRDSKIGRLVLAAQSRSRSRSQQDPLPPLMTRNSSPRRRMSPDMLRHSMSPNEGTGKLARLMDAEKKRQVQFKKLGKPYENWPVRDPRQTKIDLEEKWDIDSNLALQQRRERMDEFKAQREAGVAPFEKAPRKAKVLTRQDFEKERMFMDIRKRRSPLI